MTMAVVVPGCTPEENSDHGNIDKHDYVDLGLPSGTLWATCNVGASVPEGYGNYFAWGETQPKSVYNDDTYQYYNGPDVTKYTGRDGLITLQHDDDAATSNWGDGWHTPTSAEWRELLNCTSVWVTQNGVNGMLLTGPNGTSSLFLPAAGYIKGNEMFLGSVLGSYWSSSYDFDQDLKGDYRRSAVGFSFNSYGWNNYYIGRDSRSTGRSIRAVRSARQN